MRTTPRTAPDADTTAEIVEGATSALALTLAAAAGVVLALLVAEVVAAVVRAVGRRTWVSQELSRRGRRPLRALLIVIAVWVALRLVTAGGGAPPDWLPVVDHVAVIGLVVTTAWLIGAMAFVAEDAALHRYRIDVPDNRRARRVRTQVTLLRRVTVAVLAVAAVGGVLLTFEGARTAGTSLLASAGIASVLLGLAAQSTLANLFAGVQLAFTDAIRVDDVVVVEGQWGRIEEITLTYVVVHVWDDRRLILPSTWFTQNGFENWTRRAADLLGTVEMDLDWAVPVDEMRAELARLLNATELWDRRVGILQVTEATGGFVRVRALASAADAPTLFDLRCYVREGLVVWLQRAHPEALPRTRLEQVGESPRDTARPDDGVRPDDGTAAVREGAPSRDTATAREGRPSRDTVPQDRARDDAGGDVMDGDAAHDAAHGDLVRGQPAASAVGPDDDSAGPHETLRLDRERTSRLFTGSVSAVERSRAFSGPGQDVIEEREATAEGLLPPQIWDEPRHAD